MPVHQFLSSQYLADRGLTNYWGYDTIGFFAPHHGYCSAGSRGEQVTEFKSMVRALHEAASRSSSTWSTTTPPRAATWVPP